MEIDEQMLYTTSANNIRKFLKKETGDAYVSLTGSIIFSLLNEEITRRRKIVGTVTAFLGTSLAGFDLPMYMRKHYKSMLYPLNVSIDFPPFNVYKELKAFLIEKGVPENRLDENAMGLAMPAVFNDEDRIEEIINIVLVSLSKVYHRLNESIGYIHLNNGLKEVIIPIEKEIKRFGTFPELENALKEIEKPTILKYDDPNPVFFINANGWINESGAFGVDKLQFLLKYISLIGSDGFKRIEGHIKTPL